MTGPKQVKTPDGRSLDVYLAGPEDGTPLVFHVGTPGAGLPYRPFIEAMSERGLRYVSWNRPGYGSSTRLAGRSVAEVADDTRTVLDHLNAEQAYVAGWSGGGPHSLACAALLPDRVRTATVIAGIAPYPAEGLDYMAGMGAENIEEFGDALEGADALAPFMERWWPALRVVTASQVADQLGDLIDDVDRGSITGEFADALAESFREGLRESYWGWFDDDMAFVKPWGFELASIRIPVHIWHGRQDRMAPYAHGEWLSAHIPTACPHLSDEHGHLSLAVGSMPQILDELLAEG
jgi:pimeloyl-ACP methyl ester carboxylesterase